MTNRLIAAEDERVEEMILRGEKANSLKSYFHSGFTIWRFLAKFIYEKDRRRCQEEYV